MVTVIIFAGGTGTRMKNSDIPKQFLSVSGVPIIIKTMGYFSNHSMVDSIIVVCIESWIDYLKEEICKYRINKVTDIIPGGQTGFDSIHNGLVNARKKLNDDDVVLICDGVRPMLSEELITKCIEDVRIYGTAVPVTKSIDSVLFSENGEVCSKNINRENIYVTQAPQGYKMKIIYDAHKKAEEQGMQSISSADLLLDLGEDVHLIPGIRENIKVTTREDLNVIRATAYYEHFKAFAREEIENGD